MTENVRFTFKDGKVVTFSAKKGAEAIERLLSVDEGSSRIGEIALVDEDSPIAKAKRLFSSILYDENASCHMAIGTGFPCFRNLGDADFATKNGNKSSVHVDFMVGSQDLDIEAVTATGKHVMIMEKGHFIQQI
jgi:aminopeptidase